MQCPFGHCIIKTFYNTIYKPNSNAEIDHCQFQIKRFHLVYQSILGNLWNVLRSALLAVRHLDVTLPTVLTTRYCIPELWLTVLHHICSTETPFVKV